jgi:protein-tyrosine phosphatase
MSAVSNFRDFGNKAAASGARVVGGKLFRSGQIGPLGDTSFADLLGHEFAVIADLRFADEVSAAPMPWPIDIRSRIVAIADGAFGGAAPHQAFLQEDIRGVDDVRDRYVEFYGAVPTDPRYRAAISQSLLRIADTDGPVLVHCSAGKDRTGIVCGILLRILEVAYEDILEDYMLSSHPAAVRALMPELRRRIAIQGLKLPPNSVFEAMATVEPEYIAASFAAIVRSSGSLEHYLDKIGVGEMARARLRSRLVV